ncbi:MAG TPA: glycoside hydrolase family 99-like domain-containing protein [Stellaceae bacterium]|nr:glycoside hydrolase family 99-like domain-containing protein [Stellaceae bacterium]
MSRARPSYAGYYQPRIPADLGFYDLRILEALDRQARLAARYGLAGFCVYYYRFGGMRLLEKPLETVLAHPELPFEFCICWANENWSRRWDGGDRELLAEQNSDTPELEAIAADIVRYIRDPRYITVDGKPLVLVYRPLLLPDPAEAAAMFRRAAAADGKEIHLVYVESMEAIGKQTVPPDIGLGAAVEFPPHGIGVPAADERRILKAGWNGERYDYEATVIEAIMRLRPNYPRYPAVFPSWDNTARQPLFGTSFDASSPEVFQLYVEEKLAEPKTSFLGEERLLFVNAWNEWAEGTYLEPD